MWNTESNLRVFDVAAFDRAGINLTQLANGGPKGPRVSGITTLESREPGELNNLVGRLDGDFRFDTMAEGDLGFVTSRVATVAFPESSDPERRLWLADNGSTLVVQSPNVHVYRSGTGDYAALIYTADNGILWVTQACGCNDELGMLTWATVTIDRVKKRLQTIKGHEKRTGAIARWKSVSLPLASGAHWRTPHWMQNVSAKVGNDFVRVAGVAQHLDLSYQLEDVPCAPKTLLASKNHMAFTGDVLVFHTLPSSDDGGDPFLVNWLYVRDGADPIAA